MAKYIEYEALLDEINTAPVSMSICMNVDECKGRIYERERLVRIINAAPAADVVPVRHGHYVGEFDGYADGNPVYDMWYCSKCGCYFEEWDEKPTYNYCPNCGARMDKDGDGE